ncbi:MAG: hypothetical protein H0W70_00680 [Actinobacteria bacterium]|nr:hypothetical protein [Actinomycetota bacterium]
MSDEYNRSVDPIDRIENLARFNLTATHRQVGPHNDAGEIACEWRQHERWHTESTD